MKSENIYSEGISEKKEKYYLDIINNSKEITCSFFGDEQFKIDSINFKKKSLFSSYVEFYGNISSDSESRFFNGRIYDCLNRVYIDGCIVRNNHMSDDDCIYHFHEGFHFENDTVIRVTYYGDQNYSVLKIDRDKFFDKDIVDVKLIRGKLC